MYVYTFTCVHIYICVYMYLFMYFLAEGSLEYCWILTEIKHEVFRKYVRVLFEIMFYVLQDGCKYMQETKQMCGYLCVNTYIYIFMYLFVGTHLFVCISIRVIAWTYKYTGKIIAHITLKWYASGI